MDPFLSRPACQALDAALKWTLPSAWSPCQCPLPVAARDSDEALCFSWAMGTSLAWSVPYKVEAPPVTWARLSTRWVAHHTQAALRPRSTPFVEVTFPVSAPRVSRSMGLAPREWWGQSQGSVSCWPRLSLDVPILWKLSQWGTSRPPGLLLNYYASLTNMMLGLFVFIFFLWNRHKRHCGLRERRIESQPCPSLKGWVASSLSLGHLIGKSGVLAPVEDEPEAGVGASCCFWRTVNTWLGEARLQR